MNPLLLSDSYKQSHHFLYPSGIEYVYSNTTARRSRVEGSNEIVVFGTQYFVEEYLVKHWNENFFSKPIEQVLADYHRVIDNHLGPDVIDDEKIKYLHTLGYLPIRLKALPEGTLCPVGVPHMTIVNTDPKCAWLTNFLETISQTVTWLPITSATTAFRFRKMLDAYASETSDCPDFVQWQGHDFSMRGMSSNESCCVSGAAHALSFTGSDVIPAIPFLEKYYGADITKELIIASVMATEHSIQCAYFEEENGHEDEYIQAMLDIKKEGIISIVCDGYDYWKMISHNLPKFKDRIMSRNGKVVVRPDTGDPVKIVTGYFVKEVDKTLAEVRLYTDAMSGYMKIWTDGSYDCVKTSDGHYVDQYHELLTEEEVKGSIQVLYENFGGTVNSKGYIELDSHIGLIYGDSITYERCKQICERLKRKGFASTNVVYGIGSYTYQYVTRDTYSLACKATWVQINGRPKDIFKDPKTGDGMKKSAKGLLAVQKENGILVLKDRCSPQEEQSGELKIVFENGKVLVKECFSVIKSRLLKG